MNAFLEIWTNICLVLALSLFAAWGGAILFIRGRAWWQQACAFLQRQPVWARCFLVFFVLCLWLYGSVKSGCDGNDSGDETGETNALPAGVQSPMGFGGTNGMFGVLSFPSAEDVSTFNLTTAFTNETPATTNVIANEAKQSTLLTSHSTLSTNDFIRGFVLTRIGQNETFDFSISNPSNTVVHEPWLIRGAATDSFILKPGTDWQFPLTTNHFSRFRVESSGVLYPLPRQGIFFSPFETSLGVVPEVNWPLLLPGTVPSRFWWCRTPSESLQMTWENALYNRATNTPVSVQVELYPNGNFIYRYDLSRAGLWSRDFPSNILVGVQCAGIDERIDLSTLTNLTSLTFQRLMPGDSATNDWDGDGLTLADELFVYGTNPYETDTDLDGLSDSEEVEAGTDPDNSHSLNESLTDKMASILGDTDPYSIPEGSTNTVWEHAFYTGTTNGPFAYPQSTETKAVLTITVSGSGSGELIIGSRVVPLLAPATRAVGISIPLRLSIPRGRREGIWLRTSDNLSLVLSSEDFCIGKLPTRWLRGWVAFPFVKASEPCIHSFGARQTYVSLSPGENFDDLTCTWNATEELEVENLPPRAARLTGSFPTDETSPITYTLAHPDYLCGNKTYTQTAWFCPKVKEEDLPGDGYDVEDEFQEEDDEEEEPPDYCPKHNVSYVSCSNLHNIAFTNALRYPITSDVLKLREVPQPKTIHLTVPERIVPCCSCPDHWTNGVDLAAKSYNLAVRTASGERFTRTVEDCDVFVHGLAPSKNFLDSSLLFARTGVVYQVNNYTVLGLEIKHRDFDLAAIKEMSPALGLPVVPGTNGTQSVLLLKTRVDLPSGDIRLSFINSTARFKLYLGEDIDEEKLLLDTETQSEVIYSLANWKKMIEDATWRRETSVTLVALGEGTVELRYEFATVHNRACVYDSDELKITAIPPPILADYDRNGIINDVDKEIYYTGRPLRHWVNDDNDSGDVATDGSDNLAQGANADCRNAIVDGRCDLLDFAPVGVNVISLALNIPLRGYYDFRLSHASESVNFIETDLLQHEAGSFLTTDLSLEQSAVRRVTSQGVNLQLGTQVVLIEGIQESSSNPLVFSIYKDSKKIISFNLPLRIGSVEAMYRAFNLRGIITGDTDWWDIQDWEPWNMPDTETKAVNLFFLHGFNVNEEGARAWHAEMFKRLWQSGFNARFWGVTWCGDDGTVPGLNYHKNVTNAFATASALANNINAFGVGEKIVMAHSLGNMVVSSAIQDHGLNVSKYFMLNAAIPSEAFNPSLFEDNANNVLVHNEWIDYANRTWSAKWHELFPTNDARSKLTWQGRFADVASVAYNFYSSGDEVFELYSQTPNADDGIDDSFGRYSWHKQESYKGRAVNIDQPLLGLSTTDWTGWGFSVDLYYAGDGTLKPYKRYTADEANAIPLDALKTNTVFNLHPLSINTNIISRYHLDQNLAMGIPSLSPAAGSIAVFLDDNSRDFNLNIRTDDTYPNGWWRRGDGDLDKRWLHSDIKDAAFYFNYKVFETIITTGGLK